MLNVGNGHGDPSSNLHEAVCISHSSNTLAKRINRIIPYPQLWVNSRADWSS